MVDSDDNNLCFNFWNFIMQLFHLLGFTKELFLARQLLLLDLIRFLYVFICFRFFKEPAGIVCHAFAAFNIERLPFIRVKNDKFSSSKLFFRVTEFAHLLRMFSRFHPYF